jgi:CHAT domain-containing protein
VPCGSLGYLPLHAAWTPDTGRPTGRRYALDEVAFAYAPNARAHNAAHRGTGRPLLAAPLVVSGGTGLPAVGREAAELASLLPGAQVLTGGAATPNAVLSALRDCTLAHVGSHAASNPTEPLSSRIDLEGGPLQAHRLPGARLTRARLVVLSACETAVVGRDAPDEAVGISTALLQAGATGVIASLWAVPDEPTALLVRELYRGLLADGRHPHVALRDAQVRLRDATNAELAAEDADAALRDDPLWRTSQRYAHPYNWAAFTYAGA